MLSPSPPSRDKRQKTAKGRTPPQNLNTVGIVTTLISLPLQSLLLHIVSSDVGLHSDWMQIVAHPECAEDIRPNTTAIIQYMPRPHTCCHICCRETSKRLPSFWVHKTLSRLDQEYTQSTATLLYYYKCNSTTAKNHECKCILASLVRPSPLPSRHLRTQVRQLLKRECQWSKAVEPLGCCIPMSGADIVFSVFGSKCLGFADVFAWLTVDLADIGYSVHHAEIILQCAHRRVWCEHDFPTKHWSRMHSSEADTPLWHHAYTSLRYLPPMPLLCNPNVRECTIAQQYWSANPACKRLDVNPLPNLQILSIVKRLHRVLTTGGASKFANLCSKLPSHPGSMWIRMTHCFEFKACTVLIGEIALYTFVAVWLTMIMCSIALHTTSTNRRPMACGLRAQRASQMTQCIVHIIWLLCSMAVPIAISAHSIAILYATVVYGDRTHIIIPCVALLHAAWGITSWVESAVHAVQQSLQMITPMNMGSREKASPPRCRNGRYWRRIRYTKRRSKKQPLYKLLVLLSATHRQLCRFQKWLEPQPCLSSSNIQPATKDAVLFEQEDQRQAKRQEGSKQGIFAPTRAADSAQYGGGKGNTLNALWNKLRKTKTETQQLTTPDLFNPNGRDWLNAHQISSCLTLLLHTKYMSAVHQAAIGSAHMVCSDRTLKVLLHDASQSSLPAHADFTKVLVDSCSTEGPCPSIVIGDNLHFRNICINAKTSTIDFVDPFGHGFPTEIRQLVQDFYDMHAGKSRWTYRTWSHIMQTDNYNCGIWSIWVMEKWMQYWSQDSISTTFENYCKRHAAGLTGTELRTYYYSVLKEGCRKTADGYSALDVAIQKSRQRRPTVEGISLLEDSPYRPDNVARPSALGRRQAAYGMNSKIANKKLSLQQQHAACTEDPSSNSESADTEGETRDIQFLNNTFKPFSRSGKQLLHAEEVQKCMLYLQYTYYQQAKHLSQVGLTHEAGGTCQMQTNFSKAGSTAPLVSCAEISQTLRDSLQRSGPSPVIVFSDNSHFQVVLMNAVSKMVTLFDPFGNDFPKPVRDTVKTFFDRDPSGSWTYRTWTQELQTDTWNCGIWAIWITERWMQYWTEEDGKQPFDCWLKQHTCPAPNIQKVRQQYHDMISAALVISSDGQSDMDKIDRTLAKMWADAGQRTEPSGTETATDLKSADISTANDAWAPPANTKGQRTDTEVKPGCKSAKPAKHAAKQPTLHARRRVTMQRSNRTKCNLSTRRHQGKRHPSTVKTNSSTHESQERPNIKNNSIKYKTETQWPSQATARETSNQKNYAGLSTNQQQQDQNCCTHKSKHCRYMRSEDKAEEL